MSYSHIKYAYLLNHRLSSKTQDIYSLDYDPIKPISHISPEPLAESAKTANKNAATLHHHRLESRKWAKLGFYILGPYLHEL
tara:strand:- start:4 stop:249 length:246 start_codon:yes stop_codon:yes gene_type:complete